MKKLVFCLFAGLVLNVLTSASAENKGIFSHIPYKSATWNSKVTIKGDQGNQVLEHKIFFKENKLRTEGKFLNQSTKKIEDQIIIQNDKEVYTLMPAEKKAMRFSLQNQTMAVGNLSSEFMAQQKNAQKTGEEKVGDVDCDVYEFSWTMNMMGSSIKSHMKEWRSKKDGFIYKSFSRTEPYTLNLGFFKQKVGESTTLTENSAVSPNASLDDSLFSPDKSYEVTDMDKMMSGAGVDMDNMLSGLGLGN